MEIPAVDEALDFVESLNIDEWNWIKDNPERCEVCGHLEIFHSGPCKDFCDVSDCEMCRRY